MMRRQPFVDAKLKSLEMLCRSQGVALTVQRRVILKAVAGRTDHPTADQIYDAVKETINGVSRTTVYRVLEAFVRLGVVTRVSNPQAITRFDADVSRHHHLICLSCEAVMDCPDERLEGVKIPKISLQGFTVKDISLTITGFCSACTAKRDSI